MSKKIYGSVQVKGNLQTNDKFNMRFFNGIQPDPNTGDVKYPMYTKQEVDKMLSLLPVSRVGSMDYLPLSISGSFDSASSLSGTYRVQPTIIEDDGTGVIIRAGTNGSTYGFYYSFINNIRGVANLTPTNIISTGTEFIPSILSVGEKITGFMSTDGYKILMFQTSASQYCISITNGTFNAGAHESVKIPFTQFGTDTPVNASMSGSTIFIFCRDNTGTNGASYYSLYTVQVQDVRNGNYNSLTKITGISGQTVRSTNYSGSSNIRLYDRLFTVGTGTDSLFELQGKLTNVEYLPFYNTNITSIPNAAGTQVRVAIYPQFRVHSTLQFFGGLIPTGFSFVYDIASKTVTLDGSARAPIIASVQDFNLDLTNPFSINTQFVSGCVPNRLGDAGSICQTPDGLVLSTTSRWDSESFYIINKYNTPMQGKTPFDSWNLRTRSGTSVSHAYIDPIFGSAIGENLTGVRFIDERKVLLACAGRDNGVSYGYDSLVYSSLGTDMTYQFKSVKTGTTLNGFKPQVDRRFIDGSGYDYAALITLVDEDGTTNAYGSSFVEDLYGKNAGGLLDSNDLSFSGGYVFERSDLLQLKADVLQKASISGTTDSKIVFYYVPDGSFSKSIAAVVAVSSVGNTGYMVIAEVDITESGGTLSNAVVGSVKSQSMGGNITATAAGMFNRFNGLTVAKYNGFNYIGVGLINGFVQPGDHTFFFMVSIVKNGTFNTQRSRFYQVPYVETFYNDHGVIPGVGFGLFNMTKSDYQTKSVFDVYGTTETEMNNMLLGSANVKQSVVIVSQDVPDGYTVYISQDVPVFIAGKYYKIPSSDIDLTTIASDPSNSTFYIYVEMDQSTGIAKYNISKLLLDETLVRVYIGKVVTNGTAIDSIESEKVTRFLTYRPSTTKRGSAIPCSTGVPSATGTRWN